MLPRKHYAASEIEQVLKEQEDPTVLPHECVAEESTIRRWKKEFAEKLNELAAYLERIANVSKKCLVPPLQRVYDALDLLVHPPPKQNRLAIAYFVSQSHPVHVG